MEFNTAYKENCIERKKKKKAMMQLPATVPHPKAHRPSQL
jgi:hypothetical protein